MSRVLTINGSTINLDDSANNIVLRDCTLYVKGGYPTLNFTERGVGIHPVNDYMGQPVTLTIDGTLRFSGDVVSRSRQATQIGYIYQYQCIGLRNRGDNLPFTDENTGADFANFNLRVDSSDFDISRAGKSIGEILTTVLQWTTNAANLSSCGINVTADTLSDLAALTFLPPRPISLGGSKLIACLEGFLNQYAPNHALHIEPNGDMRFLDTRTLTAVDITLGVDKCYPPEINEEINDCYNAVLIRGAAVIVPKLAQLADSTLAEDFPTDKTLWSPTDFSDPSKDKAYATGTCTCSTTTVTIDPADDTLAFDADVLNQDDGHKKAMVFLHSTTITGVDECVSAKVVSNTALTAGGTCVLTLDRSLSATDYGTFDLFCLGDGASLTYREYAVTNTDIAAHLNDHFAGQVPFVSAFDNAAALTTVPTASAVKGGEERPLFFDIDKSAGKIIFTKPTVYAFGTSDNPIEPDNIRVLLAVNTGENQVRVPTSGFEGTAYTDYNNQNVLIITQSDWIDPLQSDQMAAYGQQMLDAVKDTVRNGQIVLGEGFSSVYDYGTCINIKASYTTGLETAKIPVISCTLTWLQGDGAGVETSIQVSNRKGYMSADGYLQPARQLAVPFEATQGNYMQDGLSKYYADQSQHGNYEEWNRHVSQMKSDQMKSDQMKSDQMKSDQMKSDQMKSDQMKSEQMKSDQMKSDQMKGDQSKESNGQDK